MNATVQRREVTSVTTFSHIAGLRLCGMVDEPSVPKVIGSACTAWVRPAIGVARCASASRNLSRPTAARSRRKMCCASHGCCSALGRHQRLARDADALRDGFQVDRLDTAFDGRLS